MSTTFRRQQRPTFGRDSRSTFRLRSQRNRFSLSDLMFKAVPVFIFVVFVLVIIGFIITGVMLLTGHGLPFSYHYSYSWGPFHSSESYGN